MRAALQDMLLAQRGALIGWVPVCLAIGIGLYFAQGQEPDAIVLAYVVVGALAAGVASRLMPVAVAPVLVGAMLISAGFMVAKYRAEAVGAPLLTFRYYGPIQGQIVQIDRSASDALRITLDQVVLARMAPSRTPERVRVSLHGPMVAPINPGDTVILTGHLSPPSGPAEPGGFDFQRHAWFLQLGAVGYTRTPVLRLATPEDQTLGMRIFAWRMAISAAVQQALPGEAGAFAAAIMTGDRAGMGQETLADLRAANLAHLLAISGLHMGLLTGFIFLSIRTGVALIPGVALRWPTKQIAAICAIIVGAFYLALSGGNVATERAFIMVTVMFVAILLGRRALTLRAVAIAATIVLLWQPEALVGPGFQMSFAATTALVAVFAALRRFDLQGIPTWAGPILSVVVSSAVAGAATAPIAAAHFNQIAHFGLIANLLSVPLMGILVMPAAVLAVCLVPLGLWQVGLVIMAQGLRWILFVADTVAARPGALSHVIAPRSEVLPLLALGALCIVLIVGRARWIGLPIAVVASFLWHQTTRPAILVADNGNLIGIMGPEGRSLSRATGSGFVAGIWLENDGRPVAQQVAAARDGFSSEGRFTHAAFSGWTIIGVSGKTAMAALDGCNGADILVTNQVDDATRPCQVYDVDTLRDTGALAIQPMPNGDLRVTAAHAVAGQRLWNNRQPPIKGSIYLSKSQDGLVTALAQGDQ